MSYVLLAFLAGCHANPHPSAEETFRNAESLYERGELLAAEREADSGYQAFHLSDSEAGWRFRLLEGDVLIRRGLSEDVLKLVSSIPDGEATRDLATHKYILEAFAYGKLGRSQDVDRSLREAERLCPEDDDRMASDLATAEGVTENNLERAKEDHRRGLELARRQNDTYREASALLNTGVTAARQEHYDESIDWLSQAQAISQGEGYGLNDEKALGNLAWDYYKLGDSENALSLYEEAERKALKIGADADQARWLNNLGLIYYQRGNYSAAEGYYGRAYEIDSRIKDLDQVTIALAELAFVALNRGELDRAQKFGRDAFDSAKADDDRPLELAAQLAQGLIAVRRNDYRTAQQLLEEVASDPGHDRRSTQWEAQSSLADLYAKEQRTEAADKEYRVTLATVSQARCGIHHEELRLPFLSNANRVYDGYIYFLIQRGRIADALRTADESRALTLAEGLRVGGADCLAAENTLNPQRVARQSGAPVLFYWLGPEHSYLFAISAAETRAYALPAAEEITRLAQRYRKALTGPGDAMEKGQEDGRNLFETLVAPAGKQIAGASRVIVISDGDLSGLNFETLLAPQPGPHYWIDDVTVINAPSLRMLAAAPNGGKVGAGPKLLLIGNAVGRSPEYGELPNAAAEMHIVEKYFAPARQQVHQRQDATAQAYFASHPEQFAYIHFVAHGTASLSSPLDSAVILSGSEDSGSKLYAREIIQHPLRAELVTVSTCYGAGARTYTGEGLVGLSWGFLRAGAHNVIGALWEVSDSSTPQLMDQMYAGLVAGRSPDQALRAAKLSLLHSDGVYRKPYYWAPFQLYTGSARVAR